MLLTADTITDAQILALRAEAQGRLRRAYGRGNEDLVIACDRALGFDPGADDADEDESRALAETSRALRRDLECTHCRFRSRSSLREAPLFYLALLGTRPASELCKGVPLMLTAETITDGQIKALRKEAEALGLDDVESWCDVALGHNPFHTPRSTREAIMMQIDAKERCAEILNDRNAK
jgi:hypothetical protein